MVALLAVVAAGERARRPASVLLLDLQGDGVYLSDVFYPVRFDVDGDGSPESMTWTALDSNDGFLWLDENGNGLVDDGTELLVGGPSPALSGFALLAALEADDGEADGVLSPDDAVWSRLGVWVDRDQNGRSTADELATLDDRSVARIDLGYRPLDRTDGTLNRVVAESTFQHLDRAAAREPLLVQRRVLEVELRRIDGSSEPRRAGRPVVTDPDPSTVAQAPRGPRRQPTEEVRPTAEATPERQATDSRGPIGQPPETQKGEER